MAISDAFGVGRESAFEPLPMICGGGSVAVVCDARRLEEVNMNNIGGNVAGTPCGPAAKGQGDATQQVERVIDGLDRNLKMMVANSAMLEAVRLAYLCLDSVTQAKIQNPAFFPGLPPEEGAVAALCASEYAASNLKGHFSSTGFVHSSGVRAFQRASLLSWVRCRCST